MVHIRKSEKQGLIQCLWSDWDFARRDIYHVWRIADYVVYYLKITVKTGSVFIWFNQNNIELSAFLLSSIWSNLPILFRCFGGKSLSVYDIISYRER